MSLLPPTTLETQPTLWSASGGQMGRRIQEHDWSQHPLGPLEDWPLSLRTTLQVMLNSRFDMWMGWGPELYFFCNDAYIPTLGLKADRALGLPAGELWAEVWDHAGPRAESVLQTGKATWDDRLLLFLERNGYPEETYHTFSYSPVPDDAGGIGGMLCVVTEETERVVGERRLGVLRDLAERLTPASAEQSWFQTLEAGLSQCTLDLPLVLVYLAEEDGRTARLKSATGVEPGTVLSPLQLELESTHQFWPVGNTALGGCNVDVLDLGAHASLTREGPWGRPTHAVLLPLQQMGQDDDTAGFLVVGLNPRRPLDAAYRGFLELFAASVCAGIAQTRALEAGRRQAQSLAELNEVRRESALQLERSEERTRLAVDAGKVGIWDWDLVAERVVWSDQSYAIFNIPPTAFDGTFNGFLAIVHPDDRDQVRLAVQRSHAGNGEYEVELRILRPDGSEAWLSTHGRTTFDAGGRPVRMHGTVVDVTERKQSEELLRVTRQRLESTLYAAEIGTWNWDIRRDVVVADENMSRLYFVGSAGKAGLPIQRFLQVIHPDDLPAVGQAITNAIGLPDGSFEEDYRLVAPDGQIRWVTARGRVIRDAQGEPEHFPGVIIDISARKRAEQALSESEQRHRKLLSLLPVPCYTLDEDGWLTFYNGAARDLWGRAPELGRVRWCGSYKLWSLDGAFISPDQCPTATALRESKVIRGAELMAERPDGSRRWLSLSSHPLFDARGRCTGVINVAIDVTDERRTQKALEENEAFLQSVISSTADSLMIMDHGGRLQWTSETAILMLEADETTSLAGRSWLDLWQDETSHRAAVHALRAATSGQVGRFRGFCPTFAGSPKWWDVMVTAVPAKDGSRPRYLSVSRDITERTKAEHALSQLAAIVESSDDAIISKDLTGRILSWNTGAERLFGYEAREIVGRSVMMLIPDDRQDEERDILDRIWKGQSVQHFETVRRRKDGTHVDVSLTVSPVRNEQGVVIGASKISRDITQRKADEAELRRSEKLYRAIGESMDFGVWICDAGGRNQYASESLLKLVGMTQAEFSGLGWLRALHPEDAGTTQRAWRVCVDSGTFWESEQRFLGVDGEWHPVLARGVPVKDEMGHTIQWVGINLDISDLKQTEEALRESEAHFTAIFQQAGSGIAHTDLEGRFVMVNDAYCEISGHHREDLLTLRVHDITHAEDLPHLQAAHNSLVQEGPAFIIENRQLRADGSEVWVRNSVVGLRDSHDRLSGTLSITQDITESRHAEEALMSRELQLRLVTDHAPVYLAQIDRNHCYKFANRPYASRYGMEVQEILGRHVRDVAGPLAYEAARGYIEDALSGREVEFEMEMPYDHLGHRWIHGVFMPERSSDHEDVTGFVLVLSDISHRKHAELELEQARDQALAAVRAKDDFLARLSHELRTPLSPVLLLASEGAANPETPPEVRADFETIRKNVDLEARLIDDLLDLTRITRGKLAMDIQPVDVHQVLRDALDTVRQECEEKSLTLTLAFHATSRKVLGDKVRLQQVFWNLLKNAVKFTDEYGTIVISTAAASGADEVTISVSDNGIGMTPEEQSSVFEAFAQGEHALHGGSHRFGGLGLGLAITRMLVELHEGHIHVSSEGRGQGTSFTISLPLLKSSPDDEAAPGAEGADALAESPSRALWLRILLVEDHDATRAALTVLLKRRGYEVSAASSVEEGLRLGSAGAFDLVISDIGLPDGNGYQVMSQLKQMQPSVIGVALSGYGMEQDVAHSHESGFSLHLTKPVRVEALDQAIAMLFPGPL